MTRERVSIATYRAARPTLLYKALCYRQWARSEPSKEKHYRGWLKLTQQQLLALRRAERIATPDAIQL